MEQSTTDTDATEITTTGSEDLPGATSLDDSDGGDEPTFNGIDYSNLNLDEAPYEHGFQPGDHIIRWDMLPILWPIQIHGIVLEVSTDKTIVTICDFGITTAKNDKNKEASSSTSNVEKMVADDDAKFKEAIQDMNNESANNNKTNKEKKRLNIITLTKWSDLRKWHKVNYDGGLISGGVGKSLKDLGVKTEKLWTSTVASTKQLFAKKESSDGGILDDLDDDSLTDLMDDQMKIVQAVVRKDSKGSAVKNSVDADATALVRSASKDGATHAKEQILKVFLTSESRGDSGELAEPSAPLNDGAATTEEPKTLAQMVAEANQVDKQSPRKIVVKSPPQSPAKKTLEEKQSSWYGSITKSLSNIFPQEGKKGLLSRSGSKGSEREAASKAAKKVTNSTPDLPRSDPPILVLARTRFLLEQGEDFLPPYHIVNSNSECIAVWCKTGRWSTLQASVFLHSTAIGNTKSTTAISLAVAATQPWLLAAVIPAGMTAIGTPWIMLKVANDKWNAATMRLTEEFWSRAEPEVFVECIEKWSQLNKERVCSGENEEIQSTAEVNDNVAFV
ncbi:hypothetical protein ACHAWO_005500 [Cyclotella atomus]|uniref:PWWP domain-containing protein n=1 Tax=Cyclotella atomus TaxID=382360 RepID=A0ABD3QC74_9STRA